MQSETAQSIYHPIMEVNQGCLNKAENPFKIGYDPELDTIPKLDPDTASYYLTIFSNQRWMIKLGRTNMITKVSFLLFHVELPTEGHLEAAINAMAHFGQRYNSRLVNDLL